ncbi:hypothetical protein EVAR_69441_1 [Eumeta japonica]|uniref:Uncharacterized protein n=1 Tax=Eumeta variegata TaxID=151549 RepID=A0A4C2AB19_EUMVA|nr:hypothetical protein EVAR_69441_1 [Eumeta japonica]
MERERKRYMCSGNPGANEQVNHRRIDNHRCGHTRLQKSHQNIAGFWEEIEYPMEWNRADGRGRGNSEGCP